MSDLAGPFAPADLRDFARTLLTAAGVDPADARVIAEEVIDAEQRGYESQGLLRLPIYTEWATNRTVATPSSLAVLREGAATLTLDGGGGWGHVIAAETMARCVEKARTAGVCVASVRNVEHLGRLGYYVEAAAREGFIGFLALSGDRPSAMMAPWGGRDAVLSTNPLAMGFPAGVGAPIVVDISTTQAARGKILLAAAAGEAIPDTWAFDAAGEPTVDPAQALPPGGSLAPMGAHKGYALAVAVEVLCGALAGPYPPDSTSVFVAAIDPLALTTIDEYDGAIRQLQNDLRASAPRRGFDQILLPGEGGERRRDDTEANGMTVRPELWDRVVAVAERLGVAVPSWTT